MIDQEISLFSDWSDLSQFRTGARLTDPITAGEIALKLRRLLLDSNPLIHIVNRTKRLKIVIPIEQGSVEKISNSIYLMGSVKTNDVGKIEHPNRIISKRIDQFLKFDILSIDRHSYSINSVITTVANNLGGVHFDVKNIDSKILLKQSFELIKKEGYTIINIDSTLCLQAPKIKDHVSKMQQVIADILSLQINDVSIKATTTEKMGFVGREEGLVAYASILLKKV